ncbi:MAG: hypothetical protein JO153_12155 [Solirubrobacterales bacterium]|nr:hypothetical protein [Solirubrobacterales bacterium]MBV9917245.1 hypothetical protein [Solirubrobacterales bacterium]
MKASGRIGAAGVPAFHVHAGHAFEGFELVEAGAESPSDVVLVRALCACGEILDVADARFACCPECGGHARACARCGETGRVIDHAALQWRRPD